MLSPLVISLEQLNEILQLKDCTPDIIISGSMIITCNSRRWKRLEGFVVSICTNGTAIFEMNAGEQLITAGAVIITGPSQCFRLRPQGDDFTCRLVGFTKSFLATNELDAALIELFQLSQATFSPVVKPGKGELSILAGLFDATWQICRQQELAFRLEAVRYLFCAILYVIRDIYNKNKVPRQYKAGRKEEIAMQFHSLILQDFKRQHHTRFYAEKIFVTPKYLSAVIKEATGRSATEIIDDALVMEAKILLQSSGQSIATVARQLGFSDQSFFTKFFKKYTGASPGAYKKTLLLKRFV